MLSFISYILAAGFGVFIAHLLSRPAELRALRLSQLILTPAAMVGAMYLIPRHPGRANLGDLQNFVQYLAIAGFAALLLAPNIAYYCGIGLSNIIDPQDWTSVDEEIALRPIQKLIDQDRFQEALAELDQMLKQHKPTYEALLLKVKLLHHYSSVEETTATLLQMISLSRTREQQLAVMEALAAMENQTEAPSTFIIPTSTRLYIHHELILFPTDTDDRSSSDLIPPGEYEVEETIHGTSKWFKLAGKNWGNAQICWEAVRQAPRPVSEPANNNIFTPIARMHRTITQAIAGKSHFQTQAQAKALLKEAIPFIRQEDWPQALPLLQKAAACDPHSYEIAYRLMQAIRHAEDKERSARVLREVLRQSRWTDDERTMLQQG